MKISLNIYFSLAYQLCACTTGFCRYFAFSKRFVALLGEHCFGNALSVLLAEQSISARFRSFVTHFTAQLISILYLIPTGHGIWTGNFGEHPPYEVPDSNGNFLSPILAGFYMFLTMIILLQVKEKKKPLCYVQGKSSVYSKLSIITNEQLISTNSCAVPS